MKIVRAVVEAPQPTWTSAFAVVLEDAERAAVRGDAAISEVFGTHERCLAGLSPAAPTATGADGRPHRARHGRATASR